MERFVARQLEPGAKKAVEVPAVDHLRCYLPDCRLRQPERLPRRYGLSGSNNCDVLHALVCRDWHVSSHVRSATQVHQACLPAEAQIQPVLDSHPDHWPLPVDGGQARRRFDSAALRGKLRRFRDGQSLDHLRHSLHLWGLSQLPYNRLHHLQVLHRCRQLGWRAEDLARNDLATRATRPVPKQYHPVVYRWLGKWAA